MDVNKIREIIKELKIYEQTKEKNNIPPKIETHPSDTVEISQEAREKLKYTNGEAIDYIKNLIINLEEFREDKIKDVLNRIKEGYYEADDVKDKAIENLIRFFNL